MKKTLGSFLTAAVLSTFAVTGCAASADGTAPSTESEVRSVASAFFRRAPLSGRRLEELRTQIEQAEELGSFRWVRNQGASRGVQWEAREARPLTARERTELAQAAFAFDGSASGERLLGDLTVVAADDGEALGRALDAIGLEGTMPDAETDAKRAALEGALRDVARTRSITVMTARLTHQEDMLWEGALVVIDEDNRQILFATGGFGT